jgi:hypothetical protein
MSIYLQPEKLEEYFKEYSKILKEKGYSEGQIIEKLKSVAQNEVIMIYTKEFMDENLKYWIDTIQSVPGGYWVVQDLIHQPHCEYEHYQWRNKMSYEKGNVGNQTAKRELSPRSYEIYQISKRMKKNKQCITECNISAEVVIPKVPEDMQTFINTNNKEK